jgi:FlaA1/EpsC-like NDP-sugar epimerase
MNDGLFFQDKSVLVTGACGTVGSELVRQLLEEYNVGELVGLDNNESSLFFLEQRHLRHSNAHFSLADVRDRDKLVRKFKGVDIVFHAAAFKHVILCERSPFEAVQTNILGVRNIIDAACECNVGRVIFTSSDKAVNPTNVMGTSKLMGERLMTAANSSLRGKGPHFRIDAFRQCSGLQRIGNPDFQRANTKRGPGDLTDPEMTRFIMSIKRPTRLVIDSAMLAKGGEVFVTKMPVIRIQDLAQVMISELAPIYGHPPESVAIDVIGFKPGEKIYEELMSREEIRRTVELKRYFAVLPAFRSLYCKTDYVYPDTLKEVVEKPYNSANEIPLTVEELRDFIRQNNLLTEDANRHFMPQDRYWPNDDCEGGESCLHN